MMNLKIIDEDSLVYMDPPYRPLKTTSSFTTYAGFEFTDDHQIELGGFYKRISNKGAKSILSNSDPKNEDPNDNFFDDLYKDFNIYRVQAKRSINSNANLLNNLPDIYTMSIFLLNNPGLKVLKLNSIFLEI